MESQKNKRIITEHLGTGGECVRTGDVAAKGFGGGQGIRGAMSLYSEAVVKRKT